PRRRHALAPRAHDGLRLVVPDRQLRLQVLDEPADGARLGLGPGTRPGVLGIPAASDRNPLRPEVPVQVDASPVLPDAQLAPVRIHAVNDPEVEALRRL